MRSSGFVTVWDVKTKKESLTLNNKARKAVSAVAWDLFQSKQSISSVRAALLPNRNGFSMLFRSQMKSYPDSMVIGWICG
jgi:hypothetical protein